MGRIAQLGTKLTSAWARYSMRSVCLTALVLLHAYAGDRVGQLIDQLRDPNSKIRRHAAKSLCGLSKFDDPRAIDPLRAAFRDSDPAVANEAACALANIRDPRVLDLLLASLKDKDVQVRRSAATALGIIRDQRAIGPLIAGLDDNVGADFAQALQYIGTPAVPALITALKDRSRQYYAIYVLINIRDPRAVEPLIGILRERLQNREDNRETVGHLIAMRNYQADALLVATLNNWNELWLAQELIDSGHRLLVAEACNWANAHNVRVITRNGSNLKSCPAPN